MCLFQRIFRLPSLHLFIALLRILSCFDAGREPLSDRIRFVAVSDFAHELSRVQEQHSDDLHNLVETFRRKNAEIMPDRSVNVWPMYAQGLLTMTYDAITRTTLQRFRRTSCIDGLKEKWCRCRNTGNADFPLLLGFLLKLTEWLDNRITICKSLIDLNSFTFPFFL